MKTILIKTLVSALVIGFGFHQTAAAQSSATIDAPEISMLDGNNVNLLTGKRVVTQTDLTIGGDMGLSHTIATYDDYFWGFRDDYMGGVANINFQSGYEAFADKRRVSIGQLSDVFYKSGSAWLPVTSSNVRLVENPTSFIYTLSDGTEVTYSKSIKGSQIGFNDATATKIVYPNNKTVVMHFRSGVYQSGNTTHRLQSVTSNTGYQLKYNYANNGNSLGGYPTPGWHFPSSIIAINNAVEYCNPTANACSLNQTWPTVNYSWPASSAALFSGQTQFTVTDAEGRVTRYTQNIFSRNAEGGGAPFDVRITGIKAPTSPSADTETYDYANLILCSRFSCNVLRSNVTLTSSAFGSTWTYQPTANAHPAPSQNQSTGPEGVTKAVINSSLNTPISLNMSDGSTALYNLGTYDSRLLSLTKADGNKTSFEYDARGNLTKKIEQPKPNANLANIIEEANYPSTCSNYKTCNKPNWVKDGRGNRNDFTYHPSSGQMATSTSPAASNGVRPKTRYSYTQQYAWVKNSAGAFVRAATPVWVINEERFCNKGATRVNNTGCELAGDEVITRYEYGSNSGPRNLHLKGISIIADGQTQRTCYTYNALGQRVAETLPKANRSSCN